MFSRHKDRWRTIHLHASAFWSLEKEVIVALPGGVVMNRKLDHTWTISIVSVCYEGDRDEDASDNCNKDTKSLDLDFKMARPWRWQKILLDGKVNISLTCSFEKWLNWQIFISFSVKYFFNVAYLFFSHIILASFGIWKNSHFRSNKIYSKQNFNNLFKNKM